MIFSLLVALLLPWAAGALWLAATREAQPSQTHPGRLARLLGYGFFVGQAMLYLVIVAINQISDSISSGTIFLIMACLALAGGATWLLLRHSRGAPGLLAHSTPPHQDRFGPVVKSLCWLLCAWIVLHLVFSAIDILSIPVYPWDAWLVWMYRAKAWFFSAGLSEVVAPGRWFLADSVPPYSIAAHNYPDYLSVTSAWLALSLGNWSETVVNVPGLAAAIAIGLALFGQLRRLDLPPLVNVAIPYFLISTPLFGAHVSLGGYADLWMAGFAGLGFVSILAGLPQKEKSYLLLGLGLLFFSTFIKNEGAVWFLLGTTLVVLFTLPARVNLIGAGVMAAGLLIAWLTGFTSVEIPGLGIAGLQDGRLHVPWIGRFLLQPHNVFPSYLESFFQLGSWNLLWAIVTGAAIAYLRHDIPARVRHISWAFLLLFISSQLFIFGLTSQGEWALQYTAINRLPLHFLPGLLFVVGLALQGLWAVKPDSSPRTRAWFAPVIALVITFAGIAAWAYGGSERIHKPVEPELRFVMGSGSTSAEGVTIEGYQQGFALLSSGATKIAASDFPYLDIKTTLIRFDDPERSPAFFWRTEELPDQPERLTLEDNGLTRLEGMAGWKGQVIEFGLLFPETSSPNPRLSRLSLEPASAKNRWLLTWKGWASFEPWSLRSINFVWGGAERQDLRLPVVVLAWVLVTLLLSSLPALKSNQPWPVSAALVFLLAWLVLDARWTMNGARQARALVEQGLLLSEQQRLELTPEAATVELIQRFKSKREAKDPARVLIVGDRAEFGYYLERAKYHLLPHSAQVAPRLADRFQRAVVDYVLFVDDFSSDGNWSTTWDRLPIDQNWKNALELADSTHQAILFRVKRSAP